MPLYKTMSRRKTSFVGRINDVGLSRNTTRHDNHIIFYGYRDIYILYTV